MYKKTLSLLGVALALSAFASQAESERQASRGADRGAGPQAV